ncbi:GNAT family N-acetyltransferase [Streptomyces sp. SID5785]|uniref:GNAT family N-acetyltransferase n=1 Tax=Streptomyces sp. SID5785 TaxID=2690309 RepID=UPI001360C9BC|nr:GNAT family N-acetyltransferase [Streptomyces sp. SID5785]MZD10119.1 GNAT family N-acetyltransferase [Streptomyces sp. SID5785]
MSAARRAVPGDAEELVRLRKVMLDAMSPSDDVRWQPLTAETLRARLADPDGELTAFVVDAPDGRPGLAACAAGTVNHSLGSPGNPTGTSGHVFNVCTDPVHRRRGYSRACVEALLDWYRAHGVARVDLFATAAGEPLYAALGFERTPAPSMRLTL